MSEVKVALIDGNNFFVSCERLFRPDLNNKPVLVLSNNDGCVVARSQEVKDMGVPMGVPYFQIKDIIKDNGITVFSSNFELYRDVSRRLFSLVRKQVDVFEQYSIDEGFFLIDGVGVLSSAKDLREKIMCELGMPVSIGIAPSKTLAKLSARRAKRGGGVDEIDMGEWSSLAPSVSLGELWGVGTRRVLAFRSEGLFSAADVCSASEGYIRSRFGVEGVRLWSELHGNIAYPVLRKPELQKSIMHSRSFGRSVTEKFDVMEAVSNHIQKAVDDLSEMEVGAKKMSIFIGAGRGGGLLKRCDVVLEAPTADPFILLSHAARAVNELYETGVSYKRAGITFSDLVPINYYPVSLFNENHSDVRRRDLGKVINSIKSRWGADSLHIGLTKRRRPWQPKLSSVSPAYTTRWDQLPRVVVR